MLNAEQLTALKTYILADPVLSAKPMTLDGAYEMADILNAKAAPAFIVWRTSVSRHEIVAGTSAAGTVFNWAGSGYITRAQGERDAFREMFNSTGTVNPGRPSIQAAFQDIFSGTGNAALNRAHIQAMSKREATVFEELFAVGTGSSASPADLVVEGDIRPVEIAQAMGW